MEKASAGTNMYRKDTRDIAEGNVFERHSGTGSGSVLA